MNKLKLKEAERRFLIKYPGGFSHPELQVIAKKHKMDKMIVAAQSAFGKSRFSDPQAIADSMVKIVGQSSMVSVFEKPKFRDYVKNLSSEDRKKLADAVKLLLHGDQERGFSALVALLSKGKIAKWPIITALLIYFRPQDEVFIKPTTVKNVIAFFELDGVDYNPAPSFAFYKAYREQLMAMKAMLSPELTPNNGALSGFLMMSMPAD